MKVVWPDWSMGRAIKAKRKVRCCGFNCRNVIEKGDFYTVHVLKETGRYEKHPICFQCKPWKVNDAIQDSRELFELWFETNPHTHDNSLNEERFPYVSLKEE